MANSSRKTAARVAATKERKAVKADDASTLLAVENVDTTLQGIQTTLTAIDASVNAQAGVQVPARGKFGRVGLLDALDAEADVWDFASDDLSGTPTKTFPTSAQSIFFSSSSASDTSVTVSARYIDSSGNEQTSTISLNGQTVVDPSLTAFDVDRLEVNSATAAVGDIYVNTENNHTSGIPNDVTTVLNTIRAGLGQTQTAGFTVPLGKNAVIKRITCPISRASGAAGSAVVHLRVRAFGLNWVVKRNLYLSSEGGPYDVAMSGLTIPARANVMMRVIDVSDNDTNVSCEIGYDLEDV